MRTMRWGALALTLAFSLLSARLAAAEAPGENRLAEQLREADETLFEAGFNRCDFAALEPLIHEDLVFYHDQTGISRGKQTFLDVTRSNICGNPEVKPIRKAVPGSFEVFPLYDGGALYGALQHGAHEFYLRRPGQPLEKTSIARFTHLWLKDGERWVLKQVYSYDHASPGPSGS